MKWQDAAIIFAMLSAFLVFLLVRDDKPNDCRETGAASAGKQLCEGQGSRRP